MELMEALRDSLPTEPADVHAAYVSLLDVLIANDQAQLFPLAVLVDSAAALARLRQLLGLHQSYPGGLGAYIGNARTLLQASKRGDNPFEGWSPSVPAGATVGFGTEAFLALEAAGMAAAAKTGFVLVAGGLGERLGYNGIKVSLPVETTTGSIYIAHFVESILAIQSLCRAEAAEGVDASAILIPLVIMTSDDTHALTEVRRQGDV